MVTILVYVLILLLVFGVVFYVLRTLPIDEPFKTVAIVVLLLIFVLLLLGIIGLLPGFPVRPLA